MSEFSTESTASTGIGQGADHRGYSVAMYDTERSGAQSGLLVALPTLTCIECHRPWLVGSERWCLKVTDDEQPETVPYCPGCHAREFGA